jgi:O-antigen/teichoic acid export membrane protein
MFQPGIVSCLCFGVLAALTLSAHATASLSELNNEAALSAQQSGLATTMEPPQPTELGVLRKDEEANRLVLAIIVTGAATVSLMLVLIALYKRQSLPEAMVAASGLVLVIFATVLIVILAKTDQQLTAPIGILGAIAGYLFGKSTKGTETEQKPEKAAST